MEKKLTKKQMLEMIKEVCQDNADIVTFCNHEIELLAKKSAKSGTTKTQLENVKVAEMLIQELANIAKPVTITDLMEQSQVVKNYVLENEKHLTNQKISAILKPLVDNGTLAKTIDKKKSYFSVISE